MHKITVDSRSTTRRCLSVFALILCSLVLFQLPAFCFDVSGDWSSEWGSVHLRTAGLNADGTTAIRGYWDQKPGQRGLIQNGGFSRATKVLWFDYFQPWNRQSGRASFVLKNSGTLFDGTYKQGNQFGNWALRRANNVAPQAAVTQTMTKGEIRRARKDAKKGRRYAY